MGNTLNCCPGSRCVKVYGDKGRLLKFPRPVIASKLMREHPDHLVVYSVLNRRKGNGMGVIAKNNVRIRVCRPGDVLRIGKIYFLVHIPEHYTAKFAKYFNRERSSTYSSPSASPLSMCSSTPGSPLSVYDSPAASPRSTASPKRSFYLGTTSPLSTYVPSPLSGSIREMTKPANQQLLRNSATSSRMQSPARLGTLITSNQDMMRNSATSSRMQSPARLSTLITSNEDMMRNSATSSRMQSPARLSTLITSNEDMMRNSATSSRMQSPARLGTPITSNHDMMRSMVNQHFQRDQIKSVLSPVRPGAPSKEKANQQFQRYPSRLVQSPGRPGSNSLSTKDTLGNIIQSRLAQSPGRPVLPSTRPRDTLANIIRQNHEQRGSSPNHFNQSPGRSTQDTLRNILKQQQRGSPIQYSQRGGLPCFCKKSPRRSSKLGAGKVSRPRRGGSRSPHQKAALLRSPVRNLQPVVVNKDVNISWLFSRESTKRAELNDVTPPQPRAPPPVLGGPVRRRMLPRLLRTRSVHCPSWTPALKSISENSPETGTAESLTKGTTPGFTPFHMQMMYRTREIPVRKPALQKICDIM